MSYTNLLYHIVFGTKNRLPLISNEMKSDFHKYVGGTVRGLKGTAFEVNGMNDHIHILAKVPPTVSISDFLRGLKANSSKKGKELGNGKFAWQRRYGAFTVSKSEFDVVRNYIRNQEKHHKKFDFKHELESLIIKNGLDIDEYLWKD